MATMSQIFSEPSVPRENALIHARLSPTNAQYQPKNVWPRREKWRAEPVDKATPSDVKDADQHAQAHQRNRT
jgi:hypothetical protein